MTYLTFVANECSEHSRIMDHIIDDGILPGRFPKPLEIILYFADSKLTSDKRKVNKIINEYAVTQLPFVLLHEDDKEPFAAIYSEEGPITVDRITAKL